MLSLHEVSKVGHSFRPSAHFISETTERISLNFRRRNVGQIDFGPYPILIWPLKVKVKSVCLITMP
jgi:hypothetical protein